MSEAFRRALAIGNACSAIGMASIMVLQSPLMLHVSLMAVLHVAVAYGFLRAKGWCPWLVGVLTSMGIIFSSMGIYVLVLVGASSWKSYLIIAGLSSCIGILLASLAYAVFRREEFGT